jgi:hypothetical protein
MSSVAEQEIETLPVVDGGQFHLVATDRPQLENAHKAMIAWAREAQNRTQRELVEETKILDHARDQKWAVAPHQRRISVLHKRVTFYSKIETALREGYVIVPNFQMNIFAIRTAAKSPRGTERTGNYNRFLQTAQILPQGQGEYRDPAPFIDTSVRQIDDGKGGKKDQVVQSPTNFDEEIHFPIALAKPALMQRTATAMAQKLFDEIGVAVDSSFSGRTSGDPILLGRIRNPRHGRPDMTFFIGWYFDPSQL